MDSVEDECPMSAAIVLSMEKRGQKVHPSLVKGPTKAISIKHFPADQYVHHLR